MRVTAIYLPFGFGHHTAAVAVEQCLEERAEDVRVDVVDAALLVGGRLFSSLLQWLYTVAVSANKGAIHRSLYRIADRHPLCFARSIDIIFGRRLTRKLIDAYHPDAIVSTFPVLTFIFGRRIQIPIVSIATDASPLHRLWITGSGFHLMTCDPDGYAQAKETLGETMVHNSVPILRSEFYKTRAQVDARRMLGLKGQASIILHLSGGTGTGRRSRDTLRWLAEKNRDSMILACVGRRRRLESWIKAQGLPNVRVLSGRRVPMELVFAASDHVIGKAGWFSLNEAVLARRVTLAVDLIPGQEEANLALGQRLGIAVGISDRDHELGGLTNRIPVEWGTAAESYRTKLITGRELWLQGIIELLVRSERRAENVA